ncbi:UvrABC system protein C [Clostridia bacterium]|nr:UvrABC system protein C [Clostridia bacterium]
MERLNESLLKKARELPMLSGIYLMKDAARNTVYIGKAKILKNRVSSYFMNSSKHSDKILRMLEIVADFDFIVTKSEYEALVLECSLIKRHQPKYNTLLKDDKGYSYITVGRSKDEWNKIQPVKKKQNDNNSYIGPFVSSAVAVTLSDQINQIFKLPCCTKRLLKKSFMRPCLNYHINRCNAPCAHKVEEEEYEKMLKKAAQIIEGNKKLVLKELKNEMAKLADGLEFERAAKIRDVIKAIQKLRGEQHVVLKQKVNCDVFGFIFSSQSFFGTVLSFVDGVLAESKGLHSVGESVDKNVSQLLVQYYASKELVPEHVVVEREEADFDLVAKFLKNRDEKFKGIVLVEEEIVLSTQKEEILRKPISTQKYIWKAIQTMAKNNAIQQALLNEKTDSTKTLRDFMRLLKLRNIPELIEIYDISNIGDTTIVGSMVTFRHGETQKSGYRRFKIKSLVAQDDYGSMREVIFRRFKNYIKQNSGEDTKTNFKEKPDLVLIDGGKQHVSVARGALSDLKLDIDVAGLVKNEKHRTKSIVFNKQEIILKEGELLNMVTRMQDEAHRFAVTYARRVHKNISFDDA